MHVFYVARFCLANDLSFVTLKCISWMDGPWQAEIDDVDSGYSPL